MSKKTEKTNKIDRNQLLKRFWVIAKDIGKENAYDVVEGLYGGRSLSALSLAELDKVVRELQKKNGFQFEKPSTAKPSGSPAKPTKSTISNRRFFVIPNGFFDRLGIIDDISTPLKRKIQALVQSAGVSLETLESLVIKMAAGADSDYFGTVQAQKVIEALKDIKRKGWQETGDPIRQTAKTRPIEKETRPIEKEKPGNTKPSLVPYDKDQRRKLVYQQGTQNLYEISEVGYWHCFNKGHDHIPTATQEAAEE